MFASHQNNPLSSLKVVIIGAGVSGATAADKLKEYGVPLKNITILEKNNRLGGKLKTDEETHIDIGGIIASIGNPAIQYMQQAGVIVENVLPIDASCLNKIQYGTDAPGFWHKVSLDAKYAYQSYQYLSHFLQADLCSAEGLKLLGEMSVANFTHSYQLTELHKVWEAWVTGMGYGDLEDVPLYRLFTYLQGSVPFARISNENPGNYIIRVHQGYQQVVESMLAPFNVKTNITIDCIKRNDNYVLVRFHNKFFPDEIEVIEADLLVLATPPQAWKNLKMDLTLQEFNGIQNLHYYRYPVAICAIEGLPKAQVFVPQALKKSGFGHVAFITTNDERDNPEGGRLATVFINLPQGNQHFSLDESSEGRRLLIEDLKNLGYRKVTVLNTKVWNDYNTTMPLDIGLALEKSQGKFCTLYLNTAMPFSFENVTGAMNYTKKTIMSYLNKKFNIHAEVENSSFFNMHNLLTFFQLPRVQPTNPSNQVENENKLRPRERLQN